MANRPMYIALLLSSLLVAGCGTAANVVVVHPQNGGKTPFGGVRHDVAYINKSQSESHEALKVATMMLCAADLPLSFVGDVVTWPYTAAFTFINSPVPVPPPFPAPYQPAPQPAVSSLPAANPMEALPTPSKLPILEPQK